MRQKVLKTRHRLIDHGQEDLQHEETDDRLVFSSLAGIYDPVHPIHSHWQQVVVVSTSPRTLRPKYFSDESSSYSEMYATRRDYNKTKNACP